LDWALLRQQAQARLEQRPLTTSSAEAQPARPPDPTPEHIPDSTHLLEELRTHQVELEIQNEELHQAQFRAEVASSRYHLLFDYMPQPVLVMDSHAFVHEMNQAARRWLQPGDGPLTRVSTALLRAFNLATRNQIFKTLRNLEGKQTLCLNQIELQTHSGQRLCTDMHLISLPLSYHSDARFLVLLVDRTPEWQRDQDRLLYQSLLDSSQDLIYASDQHGGLLLANRAVLDLLKLAPEQALGTQRTAIMPLRNALEQHALDQQVLETGDAVNAIEEFHTHPGMPARVFMSNRFPLRNAQGQVLGVGGISRDITAERQQQYSLLLSENVFQHAAEAIIVTDVQGHIVRVNASFEAMSGFSANSVLGYKPGLLRSGRVPASVYRDLWACLSEQGHWQGELINRHASGSHYTVHCSISALRSPSHELTGYVAIQTDISQLKAAETEVQRLSHYDSLTGLPNRALLLDRLQQLLALSERQNQRFAVLFADLDHFKEVNDSLGHQTGDELLCAIGQRLREGVRAQDTVARMGGDEFVLLLPGTEGAEALQLAQKLQHTLRQPLSLPGMHDYRPHASVGVALYPDDAKTSEALLRHADMAMYAAKTSGRDRAERYTARMSEEGARLFAIQNELFSALQRGELRLYLQAKFQIASLAVTGAEALVRWERPGHGLTGPGDFIAVADKIGLLPLIDRWMVRQVVQQLSEWQQQGLWHEGWTVAINQTASDLQDPQWLDHVQDTLNEHGVPARCLQIEITEGALLQPTPQMLARLQALRKLGMELAIDDFGTGYSSLAYLKSLPITTLKIDQSFVRDLVRDVAPQNHHLPIRHNDLHQVLHDTAHNTPAHEAAASEGHSRVLVEAMIALAHKLGHTVVAEGVENERQRRLLQHMGCEQGQGYLRSAPLPAAEFARRFLGARPAVAINPAGPTNAA
jgi:diguanylate cyclase (GGDEF)-like protein/PAS domain S-box-containing protein